MLEYKLGAYNHLFSCKPLKQNLTLASATFTSPIIHIYHTLPTFHHAISTHASPLMPFPQHHRIHTSLFLNKFQLCVSGNGQYAFNLSSIYHFSVDITIS